MALHTARKITELETPWNLIHVGFLKLTKSSRTHYMCQNLTQK